MHVSMDIASAEERETISSQVESLGLVFDSAVNKHSSIYIEKYVSSLKYRLAKIFDKEVVKIDWLNDSVKAGKVLDTSEYELKVFEKVRLAFHGFGAEEEELLREAVRMQNGIVLDSIFAADPPNFIVCADASSSDLDEVRGKFTLLSAQWIVYCLKRGRFVSPEFFVLGGAPWKTKYHFKLHIDGLLKTLNDPELAPLFSSHLFYFKTEQKTEERRVMETISSLLGGFYAGKLLKATTHFVCSQLNSLELAGLPKGITVVTPRYLTEIFLAKRLLDPKEFFPQVIVEKRETKERQLSLPVIRTAPKFTSFLFEKVVFLIQDEQLIKDLIRRLTENCGRVYEKVELIKEKDKEVVVVLDDGFPKEQLSGVREQIGQPMFVSHRWVDFCIEKQKVIRNLKENLHLVPFPYKVPREDVRDKLFGFKGFSEVERFGLEQVVEVLGGISAKLDVTNEAQFKVVDSLLIKEEKFKNCQTKEDFINFVFNHHP